MAFSSGSGASFAAYKTDSGREGEHVGGKGGGIKGSGGSGRSQNESLLTVLLGELSGNSNEARRRHKHAWVQLPG